MASASIHKLALNHVPSATLIFQRDGQKLFIFVDWVKIVPKDGHYWIKRCIFLYVRTCSRLMPTVPGIHHEPNQG